MSCCAIAQFPHIILEAMLAPNEFNGRLIHACACSTPRMENSLFFKSLDGLSAFECIFGQPFMLPYCINKGPKEKPLPFQHALREYLDELHPALLSYQVKRHAKLLEGEKLKNVPELEIESRALVYRTHLKHNKLSLACNGPYRIIWKRHENSYALLHLQTQRVFNRRISQIRALSGRTEKEEPDKQETIEVEDEPDTELTTKKCQSENDLFNSPYFLRSRKREIEPSILGLFDQND